VCCECDGDSMLSAYAMVATIVGLLCVMGLYEALRALAMWLWGRR